jgi:hypothetical protein
MVVGTGAVDSCATLSFTYYDPAAVHRRKNHTIILSIKFPRKMRHGRRVGEWGALSCSENECNIMAIKEGGSREQKRTPQLTLDTRQLFACLDRSTTR